jgi:hypothetical protein
VVVVLSHSSVGLFSLVDLFSGDFFSVHVKLRSKQLETEEMTEES